MYGRSIASRYSESIKNEMKRIENEARETHSSWYTRLRTLECILRVRVLTKGIKHRSGTGCIHISD